jgi:hypothetical protein
MSRSIQVFVDMAVDPAKEQEMLRYFETAFRPAAKKFQGYLDVNLLKLRSVLVGSVPAGLNYRFELSYENEELRQKWLASDIHAQVWGAMEKMLSSPDYIVLLFDVVT